MYSPEGPLGGKPSLNPTGDMMLFQTATKQGDIGVYGTSDLLNRGSRAHPVLSSLRQYLSNLFPFQDPYLSWAFRISLFRKAELAALLPETLMARRNTLHEMTRSRGDMADKVQLSLIRAQRLLLWFQVSRTNPPLTISNQRVQNPSNGGTGRTTRLQVGSTMRLHEMKLERET